MPPQVSPTANASSSLTPYRWSIGVPVCDDLLGELVDRALDAAAGDAADRGAVRADQHRRPGWRGADAPGRHHGGHADRFARPPPALQVVQHLTHAQITSDELLQRGQAVAGDELVQVRQGRGHPADQRRVARLAAVRVDPDQLVRQPGQPGDLGAERRRVAALPRRRCSNTTTAPRAVPRCPQRSRNALSDSASRVPPCQSGMASPAARQRGVRVAVAQRAGSPGSSACPA